MDKYVFILNFNDDYSFNGKFLDGNIIEKI